ncbi:intradiol ring-cleavage dioxygenase [Sphingobacterium ginsenosidimutans]|uniref:Intradiol ring-cleavage dioxygenases domain-containing protein n=1 Tax=Sphingobacterium ginsenosidimutans TaxID=687845 RepID=A0ABP7ZYS5_9SPHI
MDLKNSIIPLFLLLLSSILGSCQSQDSKHVGGSCEGCEAIFEYKNKILTPVDTLPGFQHHEPKLKVTGTVLKRDGKTPAQNVMVYIYHTNRQGVYETNGGETGWAKRHGIYRGWVKTGKDGKYTFYTFRPGAYPDGGEPEHIHITIKEPNKNEYYLDEYFFDDDVLLSSERRNAAENRGGSGIVHPIIESGILTVRRNIILGKNIPYYD